MPNANAQNYAHHGMDLVFAVTGGGARNAAGQTVGERLRDAWYEFATTGQVASWTAVNANGPPPKDEDGVWQISFDDAATRSVLGLKASACTALAKLGFGERYWWEN